MNKANENRLLVACSFGATLLMLQTGTYWGNQDLAYHQILPILFLLLALYITSIQAGPGYLTIPIIAALSILGGFSYISGAFVALAAAAVSLACWWLTDCDKIAMKRGAIGFGIGALVTLPVQLWVIVFYQAGKTHAPNAQWSLPWDWEFWVFIAGMVTRSFGVSFTSPDIPPYIFVLTIFAFVFLALPFFVILTRCVLNRNRLRLGDYLYLVIFVSVGLYVMLVAAGRTNFDLQAGSPWQFYFVSGGARFHFFWVATLVPWAWLFWLNEFGVLRRSNRAVFAPGLIALPLIALLFLGSLDFEHYFKERGVRKLDGYNCIVRSVTFSNSVVCPQIHPDNIKAAVTYAMTTKSQFAKRIRSESEQWKKATMLNERKKLPWTEVDISDKINADVRNGILTRKGDIFVLKGQRDSSLLLVFLKQNTVSFRNCIELRFEGRIYTNDRDERIQLFFMRTNQSHYAEGMSMWQNYKMGMRTPFSFTIFSANGFQPKFRLDGGNAAQRYEFSDLKLYCR